MLLGILSDTHDDRGRTAAAIAILRARKVERILHCGDVCSTDVLELFQHLPLVPLDFVHGNNDDPGELAEAAPSLKLNYHGACADLTLAGKRIAMLHGDDFSLKRHLVAGQSYDYVLHGHTHVRLDQRIGRTRVINPGALHRAKIKSVALLNLATDNLNFMELPV